MRIEGFRAQLQAFRTKVDEEADAFKDSYLALEKLYARYRGFSKEDRAMADEVIAEWVLSDDESLRFDALALVREFRIVRAKHPLERLEGRLRSSVAPGAPFELKKVVSILSELNNGGSNR
jgi:hypothetical protein